MLTACVENMSPPAAPGYAYPIPFAARPYGACEVYTDQAVIDGKPQTVYGHICPQPDGTWRIMHDAMVPPSPPPRGAVLPTGPICVDHIEPCDGSCDNHGVLGARHIHADCSRSCDLICADREGYAPWGN